MDQSTIRVIGKLTPFEVRNPFENLMKAMGLSSEKNMHTKFHLSFLKVFEECLKK